MYKLLEQKIQDCKLCQEYKILKNIMLFGKPSSFYGSPTPSIIIVGHSPKVRTSDEVNVVLNMDKPDRPLYKYINEEILVPLEIKIESIYCTNLIKCKTKILPEKIDSKIDFFNKSFSNCRYLFEEEIKTIKPQLIISLSERVLSILSRCYLNKDIKMKNAFGKLFILNIKGENFPYIPLVHIPKGNKSSVKQHYFPEQTNRLKKLNNKWLMSKILHEKLLELQIAKSYTFSDIIPSVLPEKSGIYLITSRNSNEPLYIGRTKNLKQRIYNNHLMGSLSNARLKKYLIDNNFVKTIEEAKKYIKDNCQVQFIFEDDFRMRGAIEGYLTGILFPKFGIAEEH